MFCVYNEKILIHRLLDLFQQKMRLSLSWNIFWFNEHENFHEERLAENFKPLGMGDQPEPKFIHRFLRKGKNVIRERKVS